MKAFACSAAFTFLALIGLQTAVYAAPLPAAGAAVTVSPAVQNVMLARNQDSASYASSISNNTAQALRVQVVTRDFTSLNDNGGLVFVASGTSASRGIASSLSVDTPLFVLQPHTSRSVTVTIADAAKLAGGGHYGAITYQLSPLQPNSTQGNKVAVNQTVASLLFVTTEGSGTYGLQLFKPAQSVAWFHLPRTYNLAFHNTGNVQITPRGYINISGPTGTQVATGIMNADSGLILPQTNRLFTVPLTTISRASLPGVYNLRLYYRYDGSSQFMVQTVRFFFFDLTFVLMIFTAFVPLAIVFVFVWRRRRPQSYKRKSEGKHLYSRK